MVRMTAFCNDGAEKMLKNAKVETIHVLVKFYIIKLEMISQY